MSLLTLGMNDVSEEMQAFKNKLASKDAHIAAQQSQLMRKAEELDEIKASFNDALHKLSSETERVLQLESTLSKTTADLHTSNLAAQNTSAALASAQEKLRAKELEARDLEDTLVQLSHKSDGREARFAKAEKEKCTLEARVRELEGELRTLNSSPPLATLGRQTPRTPATRERSSSLSNFKIATLEAEVEDLRAALHSRDQKLETLQSRLDVSQQEAVRLSNERMALESQSRKQIKEIQDKLDEKQEELQFMRQQSGDDGGMGREEELLMRIEEDEAKIEALERLIGDAHDMPALKLKLRNAEQRLEADDKMVRQLEGRNTELVQEKEEALDVLESVRSRIGALEADIKDRDAEIHTLKGQSLSPSGPPDDQAVTHIERLLNAVERIRGERDTLRRDIEFVQMESKFTIAALQAKVEALSSGTSPSPQHTSGFSSPHGEVAVPSSWNTSDTTEYDLRIRQEETRALINAAVESKDNSIRKLESATLACAIVIQHMQSEMANTDPYLADLSAAFAKKEHQLASNEAKLSEAEDRLAQMIQILEETTTHRNELLSQLSAQEDDWQSKFHNAVAEHREESNDTLQRLNAQVHDLSNTLDQVESERNSLSLQVTNLTSDLDTAQKELATAESRYTNLQFHQLSNMSSTEANKALRSQIEELEGRVMRRTEQIGIHQHDIRRLETNLRLQEDRLGELTTEMEMVQAQKDAMVEDCADAREQRDEALVKVERLEEEVEKLECVLERRIREMQELVRVMFENSARTRDTMAMEARRVEEMKQRVEGLLLERESLLQAARDLQTSLDSTTQRLQASEDDMKQTVVTLAISQAQLNRNVESMRQLDDAKVKVKEIQEQLDAKAAEASTLTLQLAAIRRESTETQDERCSRMAELEAQVQEITETLESKSAEYQGAIEDLQKQLSEKEQLLTKHDVEDELVRLKMKHVEEVGDLQARLVQASAALEEADARTASAEVEHKQVLEESARMQSELEKQVEDLSGELARLRESQKDSAQAEEHHSREIQGLQERLTASDDALRTARRVKDEIETSHRQTVNDLEQTRKEHDELIAEIKGELSGVHRTLDEERQHLVQAREEISALDSKLQEEARGRAQETSEHEKELLVFADKHQAAEKRAADLSQRVVALETQLQDAENEVHTLQEEKNMIQGDMTALEANIQRSISMNRHLESQIREGDRIIADLRAELEQVNKDLARVEKACNAAEVKLNLQGGQHKREVSQLQREVESLKSRPNLEQAVAELEERNNEMEELLRRKCEEIEDNDDHKLELLKENKSLRTKVESLTRKVQNLQAKLAAAKAALPTATEQPRASSSPRTSSVSPSGAPVASASRPRATTLSASVAVPPSTADSATPPVASERLSRVVSTPSSLPRPKTPERRTVLAPVLKAMSPKKQNQSLETPSTQVSGKKRRAPDDFESYDIPPQAFTAESLPGDREIATENTTPKVRRVLSSIQSGFTPVRHQNPRTASAMPMPSPRRSIPAFKPPPAISNSASGGVALRQEASAIANGDGKPTKRSWLGKIRGASTSAYRTGDIP